MRTRPYHSINFVCNPRICAGRLLVSIIFRLVVVVVSGRGPGGGARVRLAENDLCYKAAFFFLITQMYAHF